MRSCAATAVLLSSPVLESWGESKHLQGRRAAHRALSLNQDWLFGGKFDAAALETGFQDSAFSRITLPHCVAPLSWHKWDPASWEDVWIYRRHFSMPKEFRGLRTFLHFDRVMVGATPVVNGHRLPRHLGGFLPFEHEITGFAKQENVLAVAVDSRWLNVPPAGNPRGPKSVDYLLPGGISGSASLRAVPSIFIRDVFAKPVDVLQPNRRVEIKCSMDAGQALPTSVRLVATLRDGLREVASVSRKATLEKTAQEVNLTLGNLGNIVLWHVDRPQLYDLVVTLFVDDKPLHDYHTRIGFRDARFEVDGFFLNGDRFHIFGLDRHELYPYVGFSASNRALRRDAEILRRNFNCNTMRCSHYPQSEAFLDACDELGIMVWEETPGWQYLGDEAFQKLVLQDVEGMVRRDRNHPSVILWGVRVNESRNDPALYTRTREIAYSLDGSRPTSGSMTSGSEKTWKTEWRQDVFAYDDYESAPDGSVKIKPPLPGVPYLITEAVGQYNYGGKGFKRTYRRAGDAAVQQQQALLHAQAHSKAAAYERCAGLIAWCAFDYASLLNAYEGVKCPGVADVFRIPKLGASFYLAQVDPGVRPVIEPDLSWDFGPQTPSGPGERAAIFSNCDRLELFIDGKKHSVLRPDRAGYPNLKSPPFFADLKMDGSGNPELRIDGYSGGVQVLSRSFSSDRSADRLWLQADDAELRADGSDSTRLAFGAADKFGALRTTGSGEVSLKLKGPGLIVGDYPFRLEDSGGVGAVWIKTLSNRTGQIRIEASHAALGRKSVAVNVRT
jgi:beta-galactosidase